DGSPAPAGGGPPPLRRLSRTLAPAVPPAGEATCPTSLLAITALLPSPVGRQRKTPVNLSPAARSLAAATPKDPPMDTGVVPSLTLPTRGKPEASVAAVQPDANCPA